MSEDSDVFFITPNRQDEHFSSLKLKIWKLGGLWGQEGHLWLVRVALKIIKIQIFSFMEEKCSSVWSYDKISIFSDKKVPLSALASKKRLNHKIKALYHTNSGLFNIEKCIFIWPLFRGLGKNFVVFLVDLKIPKCSFKIDWPLDI